GRRPGQWRAGHTRDLSPQLLRGLRFRPRRPQHRSGVPRARLTFSASFSSLTHDQRTPLPFRYDLARRRPDHRRPTGWRCVAGHVTDLVPVNEAPWHAAMLGLRDYVHKNGFKSVVLGLSGGIDSAVVAALAVDALGAENVHCVMLPYRYTSEASLRDAKLCAQTLGVRYDIVPIGTPVDAVNENLAPLFAGLAPDITEENLQSRMRGTILMAISNKLGSLLITTGNKSEMAVGYATIYGDMNGAYNPIKDMLKTQVYELAKWRNGYQPTDVLGPAGIVIPPEIIDKAPSAELRPDQTDQDSLPPYPVLDAIISDLVEE